MKHFITILVILLGLTAANAQDCRIPVELKVTDLTGKLDTANTEHLANALRQSMIANGLVGAEEASRFAMTASVGQNDLQKVAGMSPIIIVSLDVNLYMVNTVSGEQLAAETLTLNGTASSEGGAYRKAANSLKGSDQALRHFMAQSGRAVSEYYDKQLTTLLREVDALCAQRDFSHAMWVLSSIPTCVKSYDKVLKKMDDVFSQYIDLECSQKLQAARALWAASQNLEGARGAVALLAAIDPEADCKKEAEKLLNQISDAVKDINDDNAYAEQDLLEFYKEMQRAEIDNEKARIEAMRAIGKAYGENQREQNLIIR